MTNPQDAVRAFINDVARIAEETGLPGDGPVITPGDEMDRFLVDMFDQAGDARAHREAVRLRQRADLVELSPLDLFNPHKRELILALADLVDPYKEQGGQLVRKSDGKPVVI